jgi:cytosine/creatinine deaminase
MIPDVDRYWLKNAHIPISLLENCPVNPQMREGLSLVDIEISDGAIAQIVPATSTVPEIPFFDLHKGIIFPGFIDMHTHLDKGHIWERSPNLEGTFENALITAKNDYKNWHREDLYHRMEFGIKCSYAQGTTAIRTHLDSFGKQAEISLEVFQALQKIWSDKVILQAVSLVSLDYYQTSEGVTLANLIAKVGGILGGVAYMNPNLDSQLDTVFSLAKERNLNLDFHADENGDLDSICLQKIAAAALRNKFSGQIICGHCCSLAIQFPEVVANTLKLVKEANIGIVSLPMCNLYLQDRKTNRSPLWRGITDVYAIKKHNVSIAFASDNCRDPFYGFGNHDMLEVFTQAVRIAHLDTPYDNWCASVTKTPADLIGLPQLGRIGVGLDADLILFKARYYSELLSRPQSDRIVIRQGKPINTTLPDYSELDICIFKK